MIEIKDIYKSFGDNEVLKGISGKFEAGVTNLIIGGSGSGKTTLLKCMIGLHQPEQGSVLYDDREFTQLDIIAAIKATLPLSRTMTEQVTALRDWARQRARPAASSVAEYQRMEF